MWMTPTEEYPIEQYQVNWVVLSDFCGKKYIVFELMRYDKMKEIHECKSVPVLLFYWSTMSSEFWCYGLLSFLSKKLRIRRWRSAYLISTSLSPPPQIFWLCYLMHSEGMMACLIFLGVQRRRVEPSFVVLELGSVEKQIGSPIIYQARALWMSRAEFWSVKLSSFTERA